MLRNFNRQLLVAIFLTAATGSFGSDFWPVEYSFEETYVGEASVARGPHRVEDFDECDTLLRLVLTPRVKLGVSIDVERKYPVIPGGGIRWKFQPKWVLNAVMPTPRLEYEWNKNLTLYAGATLKETNFRVSDEFGRDHGIPRLNHAVLTYSEVRAGGGIDWKVTSWLSVNAEAGYQPYRNFDFYRANIRFHEHGSAPYGMIALHGAF